MSVRIWSSPDCTRQPMMVDVLPSGVSVGEYDVVHYTFTEDDSFYQRLAILKGCGRRGVNAVGDKLCQIRQRGVVWMSESANERWDHADALREISGSVLVGGLGLGLFALSAMIKPGVNKVTVLERSPEVIALVEDRIRATAGELSDSPAELRVVECDVWHWLPDAGEVFTSAWFDIWLTLCADDLEEHDRVRERFSESVDGFFGFWGEGFLRNLR